MAVAAVSGSFASAGANFIDTQTISVNCGSGADRFVFAVATATNAGASGSRNIVSATYGGVALTISSVFTEGIFGKFLQVVYGPTSLTGANDLVVTVTDSFGQILMLGGAFEGVDATTPVSDITNNAAINTTPTWTVDSATGDMVAAGFFQLDNTHALTATSPATAMSGFSSNTYLGMYEAGASSVTIDGTLAGSASWSGLAFSIKAAAGGGGGSATSDIPRRAFPRFILNH